MDLTKKRKLEENGLLQPIFDISVADVRKILEPLTHDQLLNIVQNAVVRHLDVLDAVRSIADQDMTQRKLFIRGLGWDTTNDKLAAVFNTYGELEEAVVILDKATGKSKGFGFVTFKHIDGAIRALKEPSKKIDGRMTVTNLASAGPGGGPALQPPVDVSNRKIYVANVPYDMPADRLLGFFLSYGEVEEGPLGFDKLTGKSKGFALFVYKTEEAARAALVEPTKNIDGVQLNCKMAIDGKKGKPPGAVQNESVGNTNGVGVQQTGMMPGSVAAGQYGGPAGVGGVAGYGGVYTGGVQGPSQQSQYPQNPSFAGVGVGGPGFPSVPSQTPTSAGLSAGYGYASGIGGPYGGSQYAGAGSAGYGGLGGAGSRIVGGVGGLGGVGMGGTNSGAGLGAAAAGGLGGAAAGGLGGAAAGGLGGAAGGGLGGAAGGGLGGAASGLGGPGRMSSMYGLQPNSAGMPSGAYSDSAHYSLSGGSRYPNQHQQTTGASPAARVPYSGMYPPRY